MSEAKLLAEVQAIGYEGDLPENCSLTWGAAALRVGDQLVNAVTGSALPIERLDEFTERRTVCLLSVPVILPPDAIDRRLFVVVVRDAARVRPLIHEAMSSYAMAVGEGECWSYVVEDDGPLQKMMAAACACIVDHVQENDENASELVRCGLILDPFHPLLNALRVLGSPPHMKDNVLSMARVCVKTAEGRLAFDDFLRAKGMDVDWDWSVITHVRKN